MKLIPTLLTILALSTTLAIAEDVKHVKSKEAAELIAKGDIVVLDVRSPDEFAEGHIDGAQNINLLDEATFKAKADRLDKSKTYLVHCEAGGRSTRSLETLKALGFEHLIHLDDGFGGWKKSGLPVKR